MAREWVKTPIKSSDELSRKRSAQLEEQTKRASEEATRKYQEYLASNSTHAKPEARQKADSNQVEKQNIRKNITVTLEGETVYTSKISMSDAEKERFVQRMYGGTPIAPPVIGSNQRAIAYEQKRRAAKEYAEHYAENRERDVQRAMREADAKAKEVFANMSEEELKQYAADMAAIKLGNEQRTQRQIPKAIREHQMSPETYAKHIAKQKEKQKDPEYRAKLQQQKKNRHITHGKTTVRPLAPMPNISGPLKPPCSN